MRKELVLKTFRQFCQGWFRKVQAQYGEKAGTSFALQALMNLFAQFNEDKQGEIGNLVVSDGA